MTRTDATFLYATCQPGAENALKGELARTRPELRSAYSRPGLVTFRAPGPVAALQSVFARSWGTSLGSVDPVETARALGPVRLHVFDREPEAGRAAAVESELRRAASFLPDARAQVGETVLDVIVAEGEPPFLGTHTHTPDRSPWPGGGWPVEVPFGAPSRAYRKLVEALAWSRAPLRSGDVAVEIGSAPGGASYALLERGLEVIGVDPGDMAPIVLQFVGRSGNRFKHLRVPVGELRREALPARVDWLLLDVNLAPQVALHNMRRLVAALRRDLAGVLFTLKLNEWSMASEVPSFLERVAAMGLRGVRATQLPSNRQEICVYARTARRAKPARNR